MSGRTPILAILAVLALGLAGCASQPDPRPDARAAAQSDAAGTADPARLKVIFTAMQQVGVPYRWGGASPAGFDCSGLVQYAYGHAGYRLPRTAADQLASTATVALDDAAPGDLLFFRDQGRTSHVAIYLGDGRFVHAPRGGRTVSLADFDNSYWRSRFARAGRVLSDQ